MKKDNNRGGGEEDKQNVYQLPESVILDIISKLYWCPYREVQHLLPALRNMVREARKNDIIKIEKNRDINP